jgi:hypothetical protein
MRIGLEDLNVRKQLVDGLDVKKHLDIGLKSLRQGNVSNQAVFSEQVSLFILPVRDICLCGVLAALVGGALLTEVPRPNSWSMCMCVYVCVRVCVFVHVNSTSFIGGVHAHRQDTRTKHSTHSHVLHTQTHTHSATRDNTHKHTHAQAQTQTHAKTMPVSNLHPLL